MNRPTTILCIAATLAAALAGCDKREPKKIPFPGNTSPETKSPETPAQPEQSKPSPPPRMDPAPAAPSGAAHTITFKGFSMDVPAGWQTQSVPTGGMRAAQFEWPGSASADDAPTCIAFIFPPGQGGNVESNLVRWRGMFVEEGDPTPGRTEELASSHGKITLFEKSGTFKLQATPMAKEFTPRKNWQMLAAVAEIGGSTLYFRATGPEAGVQAQRDAMITALKSLRKAGG